MREAFEASGATLRDIATTVLLSTAYGLALIATLSRAPEWAWDATLAVTTLIALAVPTIRVIAARGRLRPVR